MITPARHLLPRSACRFYNTLLLLCMIHDLTPDRAFVLLRDGVVVNRGWTSTDGVFIAESDSGGIFEVLPADSLDQTRPAKIGDLR